MDGRSRNQSASFPEQAAPPASGTCARCNAPLGSAPYYILDYPDGEHVDCWQRHIAQRGFPYGAELEELRGVARRMSDAYSELVAFGKWLGEAQRAWPGARPRIASEYRARRSCLKQALAALRARLPE